MNATEIQLKQAAQRELFEKVLAGFLAAIKVIDEATPGDIAHEPPRWWIEMSLLQTAAIKTAKTLTA